MEAIADNRKGIVGCVECQDRIAAQLMFAHLSKDDDSSRLTTAHSTVIESQGRQSYVRRLTINDAWEPLDTGWLRSEEVGIVILENKTGRRMTANPTEKEKEAIAKAVLEVCLTGDTDEPHLLVVPGGFQYITPVDASQIRLRSACGPLKLTTFIVPR